MSQILQGLAWAFAILLAGFAGKAGWVTKDMATTLVLVLPVMAVLSLSKSAQCRLSFRAIKG